MFGLRKIERKLEGNDIEKKSKSKKKKIKVNKLFLYVF